MSPDPGEPHELSEAERLTELEAYHVLDTEPEAAFDGLAEAAASIADTPTAMVVLLDEDRQWFKARVGHPDEEGPRETAFCRIVVEDQAEVIVPDATTDPRFEENPLVTEDNGIRLYAGFPLQAPSGAVLGTLCVLDRRPRELSDQQHTLLRTLAEQVMTQLQLRRELLEKEDQLNERNQLLASLAESRARLEEALAEGRRVQEDLRQARDLFAQVLSATEQSIIATDRKGIITLFNAGSERMLGYTAAEMVGRRPEILHDQGELVTRAKELGVMADHEVFVRPVTEGPPETREWTYIRKDGERVDVQLTATFMTDSDGTRTGHLRVASDITQQRRLERERHEHAQMLRAVIENNQSIIYVKDLQGRYLMVNRAWEEALGLSEAEVLGRTDAETVSRELAPTWDENNRLAREGLYRVQEYIDAPGGRRFYDSVKVPLKDAAGITYAICGLSLDITERRRAEQAQAQAVEAMATARDAAIASTKAKSAFLATMSHEIRTPMNAVIGMTGLLLETSLDADQRDMLEIVRTSGDQLLSIINDILDFSKIEAGDLELESHPFDLRDLVEGTIAQFTGTSGPLDLISHVADDCPQMVVGDPVRLRQVLGNLVGNAVKFTEAGDVLLKVGLEDDAPEPGSGKVRLRFTVADTGIGISPEGMERLFKSFSQVDASTTRVYGGTGLGLAISKALVQAMGGDLTVSSTPGLGSEFTFAVPLELIDDQRTDGLTGTGTVSLQGRDVLIVDDNATNRRILQLQLQTHGMTCTTCASPLDALSLVGGGVIFDVAILDFAMPMMDGSQLAMTLRALPAGRSVPLILLSSIGTRDRNNDNLFAAVLTKPTRSAALIQTVAEVLGTAAVPGAAAQASGNDDPGTAVSPRAEATDAGSTGRTPSHDRSSAPAPVIPAPRTSSGMARRSGDAKLNVLLAEDNVVNQKVGRMMLTKIGHHVEIANNGQEALEAVRAGGYDVVLMDMHMPVMDGLEATRRIRSEVPQERQPRIIALTASVTTEDRAACAAAGMDDYLPKPVRAADLAGALGKVRPR